MVGVREIPPATCPTSQPRAPCALLRWSSSTRHRRQTSPQRWAITTALPGACCKPSKDEGYLQRGHRNYRERHTYSSTPRLLALAGQLAARLPLVTYGAHAVQRLSRLTGLDAYLVVPSYGDVIVLARGGDRPPAL